MNKWLRVVLYAVPILLICSFIFISTQKSIQDQISDALKKDESFQDIIYTQMIGDELLTFYRTKNQQMNYGLFRDNRFGFGKEFIRSGGSVSLSTTDAITWKGLGAPNGQLNLLCGAVANPDVTQIIIISEGNQAATIVEGSAAKIWFLAQKSEIKLPITIQAKDKDGKVLYEYGDLDYWTKLDA